MSPRPCCGLRDECAAYSAGDSCSSCGGGFDLDGGVQRSVIQYNYSRDNDGPGYMVMTFPDSPPTRNNVVRFNVSADDARRNDYAAIQVLGEARNVDVVQNAIVALNVGDSALLPQGSARAEGRRTVRDTTGREGIPTETQARERRGAARRARGPTAAIEVLSSQYVPGDPRNEPANVRVRDNLILSSVELPLFRMDYSSSTIQNTGNRLLRP